MLNMALLLRIVNEGEHVVVNQVVEEVNPSVEVGIEIGGTTPEPNFSVNEGKPISKSKHILELSLKAKGI